MSSYASKPISGMNGSPAFSSHTVSSVKSSCISGPTLSTPTDPAVPLPIKQIAAVKESLVLPYYELSMAAYQLIDCAGNEDGWDTCAQSRYTRTIATRLNNSIASIMTNVAEKGVRPGVVCDPPFNYTGETKSWVFPMGTFDAHDESSLPAVFREFALQVSQFKTGPNMIQTSPRWRSSKRDSRGIPATQWVVAIPLSVTGGIPPTEPWKTSRGCGYSLSDLQYSKLYTSSIRRTEAFLRRSQREPRFLEDFVNCLEKNEEMHRIQIQAEKRHPVIQAHRTRSSSIATRFVDEVTHNLQRIGLQH